MKKINYLAEIFFFACLIGVLYLWYVIYKPFLGVVLIAAALASVFYPIYLRLLKRYRRMTPTMASGIMIFFIFFIVLIPLILFLFYLSTQIEDVYLWLSSVLSEATLTNTLSNFNVFTERMFNFTVDKAGVLDYLANLSSDFNNWLISLSSSILNNAMQTIANFFFLLIAMFFMFRDGKKILLRIMVLTPLYDRYDMEIYKKFQDVSSSALMATFLTAIAQGIVAAVAYVIVGLPFLFLGLITGIAAVIPLVGTLLIWGPLVIYFLIIGAWWKAIFLALWGMIVIGLVDNFLRPWLMKGKTKIHPMILFFGILGGIVTFGFWGIVYGPLIIAIGLTLLHIYSLEYSGMLKENKYNFYKRKGSGINVNGKKKVIVKKAAFKKKTLKVIKVEGKKRGRPKKKI